MKRLLGSFALLLTACGPHVSMDTPVKHAIATFIAGAMSDPSTYHPAKLTKDSAFTRRDLLLFKAKNDVEEAKLNTEDSINAAVGRHDTIAVNRAITHFVTLQRQLVQLRLQKPGKRLGDFYTHTFYYKTKEGKEEYQEVFLRVYDSALVVKTLNGYNLELL